jgi:hypothetical protein
MSDDTGVPGCCDETARLELYHLIMAWAASEPPIAEKSR